MLIFVVVLAFILGWVSQSIGLCLVLAMRRLLAKKPMLILTLISCGLIGLSLSPFYRLFDFDYPFYYPNQVIWITFLGGMIFGVGAAINNGCNIGTIKYLSRGNSNMLITIAAWMIGNQLWNVISKADASRLPSPPTFATDFKFYIGLLLILIPLGVLLRFKREKRIWSYTTILGILASGLFIMEPHWTPSSYFNDVAEYWVSGNAVENNVYLQRGMAVAALISGMFGYSFYHKIFEFQPVQFKLVLHHLFAGILMGIGASMALGGNDTQILLVFPTLTAGSVVPFFAMCLGIYAVMFLEGIRKQAASDT